MTYNKYILTVSLPYLAAMLAVTPLTAQTVTAPLPPGLSAQRSYVLSRTVTAADGSACLDHVDYDNGLGQIHERVDVGASPGGADLVTLQEYDGHGRPSHAWLPGLGSGGASVAADALKLSSQTLNGDDAPYTLTVYERSPIGRPTEETLPGAAWHQGGKKRVYTYNQNAPAVKELTMEGNTLYIRSTPNYTPLRPVEVRDEAGTLHIEYTDADGRMAAVCDRPPYYDPEHVTYYVRDDAGRLRFVLPPEAYFRISLACGSGTMTVSPDNEHLRRYGYEYRYDGRGNCIYKRLPGCEPVYYIYDKADRPILSQDGVQRLKGQWSYAIPDIFGRTVLTGTCHNGLSYTSEPLHGTVVTAARDANAPYGYTVSGLTLSYDTVYTATFYDDYGFIGSHGFPATLAYAAPPAGDYGTQGLTAPRGLPTGMATGMVSESGVTGYLYNAMYYDDRGRVIQTRGKNAAGGIDNTFTRYDFTGHVLCQCHQLTVYGPSVQTELYTHTYDHAGRLLTVKHRLNGGSEVTLRSNTYDGLGLLSSCTQGGTLTTAYTYNVRSWPTAITADTLFTEHLYYNESHGGNTPDYRGNISAMEWKAGGGATRAYNFAYDYHNRLREAVYKENGTADGHYSTYYDYDRMGNITTLVRIGLTDGAAYSIIDNLDCAYEGNRLTKVEDSAGSGQPTYYGAFHFDDGADSDLEYAYDQNGNMTKDLNKDITEIKYNLMNLPAKITYSDGKSLSMTYSADGERLSVTHNMVYAGDFNAYFGPFIYRNGSLQRVLVDGGYVSGSQYHFYLTDHQGNNRVVVRQDGTVEQVNHYYPYGGLTGESTGGSVQPYKYNGKELERMNGLDLYDYGARWMDAALGRFTTIDPLCEKYYGISPYAYCAGNPIMFIDENGDSIIVDNYGYIQKQNGTDKNVFLYSGESKNYTKIGVIGGTINIQGILPNMFYKNAAEAKKLRGNLFADISFINKVKTGGEWDLKTNKNTIFGFDNSTRFLYNNEMMSSEDVGNMNFGVVAKAFGYSQEFAKCSAGLYQMWEGHSKKEWRSNNTYITAYRANQFGIVSSISICVMGPPYGDDPHDQYWIGQGYQFK